MQLATPAATPDQSVQYIPRNMHTVFALLCFVVVIHWLIFPYSSGLLHWHCGNLTIAPVPAKQPWWIWINTSCEFIMNDYITTTKQSTTKPCAYFLGYTVHPCLRKEGVLQWEARIWEIKKKGHFFLNKSAKCWKKELFLHASDCFHPGFHFVIVMHQWTLSIHCTSENVRRKISWVWYNLRLHKKGTLCHITIIPRFA